MKTKPKILHLKEMPPDVRKILIAEQAKIKIECDCMFSLEQTAYKLIRKAVKEKGEG
jgi:hypothetical protein